MIMPWCGLFSFDILGCPCPDVGGVMGWSPLARLWVFSYVVGLLVGLYMGSGLVCLSFARGVGLVIFCWFAYWHMFFFFVVCCGLMPPSPILGEVLSGFGSLFWPFGNKFLIIQNKEIPHDFTPMRGIQHQIDLIPGLVFPNKLASMKSPKEHGEFKTQVDDFLDKGLVEGSESSFVVPTMLVHEKDGSWSMCFDCQAFNNIFFFG